MLMDNPSLADGEAGPHHKAFSGQWEMPLRRKKITARGALS
jgi:hypothetical protein